MVDILTSIVVVAIITTLVTRPKSADIISQLFGYLTGAISAVLGTAERKS